MKHPHILALEKFYGDWAKGDLKSALSVCADSMTFQVSGKSALAGKYNRDTLQSFSMKQQDLSQGTFVLEVHDILASDIHATVLATESVVKDGKKVELRTVHVWRFESGKPLAGYEYPRDLYQFDAIWGA